jgi:hypothetical protein
MLFCILIKKTNLIYIPWLLNCNIYNKMEPRYNVNDSEENQEDQNLNLSQPPNVNTQIDEGLVILRTLEE